MPRIYNAPTIQHKTQEKAELKGLLIVGPNTKINPEIKDLYEKTNNYLIIGDGVNPVTLEDIRNTLTKKNLKIGINTRIDIDAHGIRDEKKEHFIQLGTGNKDTALISTKKFFEQLRTISNSPLYVHLWACYGGAANKFTNSLGNDSTLITHIESKEAASTDLSNHSMKASIHRYLNDNLSPYQQFIKDLPENYEAATFNKVTAKGIHHKFKTMRTPKNETMAKIIEKIDTKKTLADSLNSFFSEEGARFQNIFANEMNLQDKQKVRAAVTEINTLSEEQAKNYALGVLIHVSSINQTENHNLVKLIEVLKNKGISINDSLNNITPLELAVIQGANDNVRILLEHDANPNLINSQKRTSSLLYAYAFKEYNVLKTLIEHNADVNLAFNDKTLLSYAIEEKDNKLIDLLLKSEDLKVDKKSATYILKENIRKEFKGKKIPTEKKQEMVKLLDNTIEQLVKNNPSINFRELVKPENHKEFFEAFINAVIDPNKQKDLIKRSEDLINTKSKQKITPILQEQAQNIGKVVTRHLHNTHSKNTVTPNANRDNRKGIILQ